MAAELAELERSKVPELQKAAKRAQVRRSMSAVRLQLRRGEMSGLCDETGRLLTTATEVGAALQNHWRTVFSSPQEDQEERDAAERFLQHTIVLAAAEWQLDEDVLQREAQATPDTCPGMPHARCGVRYPRSAIACLTAVGAPQRWGASVTHCIPTAEAYDEARRPTRPGGMRPRTRMQTSAKIGALTANEILGDVAEQTVAGS